MATRWDMGSDVDHFADADACQTKPKPGTQCCRDRQSVDQNQRCVVLKRATIRGKKVWGRKRHLLVDTEGNLLAVKVTGAEQSDQQGGKRLMLPLREAFPRLQLIWENSHYGGTFVTWLKEHLEWKMQTVLKAKIPTRGLLGLDR